MAGLGYAFAQVTPRGDRNFENRTISIVYAIDEGPRTYVERIEIRGNDRSRDYVVRREFDISEGDAFNQVLVQRAKRRLEALDFFTSVEISTAPGSQADQVILVVDLVEKSTGEFSIGGGYTSGGDTPGPSIDGSITERNFLGRGQFIRFSAGGGKNSRDFQLSFTEPYFLGRRIAAGFDIYRQSRTYDNYKSVVTGGTIRFGLPITQDLSTQVAYNLSQEEYTFSDNCDFNGDGYPRPQLQRLAGYCRRRGEQPVAQVVGQRHDSLQHHRRRQQSAFGHLCPGDGRDRRPRRRRKIRQGDERGPATIIRCPRNTTSSGWLTGGGGHIEGFSDDGLRTFDLFKSSDRIIRGFEYNGIGPFDANTGEQLGGQSYLHASAEAQFPLPVVPESFGLRGAVFADAATLFDNHITSSTGTLNIAGTAMDWRASVGAGLIWASPFGPLRVDYAFPVLKEESDDVQNFNFGISTRF